MLDRKTSFKNTFEHITVLHVTVIKSWFTILQKTITFTIPFTLFLVAKSPETVDKLEGLVALWAKEIELVLAKSEQVY